MPRLVAVVHGRVQGVGFRRFVERRAHEAGVSVLAWNRPDGTVEVRAEGGKPALDALLRHLEAGPATARVDRVEEMWSEIPGAGREAGWNDE